jgi:3-dehydroquinate synthase
MNEYEPISYDIAIPYQLRVFFTRDTFLTKNVLFRDTVCSLDDNLPKRVLVYVDENIPEHYLKEVEGYFGFHKDHLHLSSLQTLPGGEVSKNSTSLLARLYTDIDTYNICRHCYIAAIGGGAVLDVVGYAAATAHRGIRHIRLPSTTLAQADAGVGVKNGINFNNKKNFVGSFAPPIAVINDFSLLHSLSQGEMNKGYIEAVKMALIKDGSFFEWIEDHTLALNVGQHDAIQELVYLCARLHVEHIANSGDPFEAGSVRPLDFGHWAAHKLEQLSNFRITHGEAVAIGIALDTVYSQLMGYIEKATAQRIISLLKQLQFHIYTEVLGQKNGSGNYCILDGLEEFREHLGGTLTITLLHDIGSKFEVHEMDKERIVEAINFLRSNRSA